ncbi:SDR family oxidoreductase [Streptomyces sp. AM2-3-1]|uniref:SDR family oxidoreductase n=1 Tax=unclassified Streptomyces TaxID=2593676 RepID=UPI0028C43CB6|nr:MULTISPECIES: SDR family oxidoreductase [unclassified Streptomyces]WNO62456.1 SDR family oxidoreductase [Streptomyces sp. AM2-3-1]
MRSLAIELAARRIRVDAVSPGVVNTPAYSKLGIPEDTIASRGENTVPVGRIGAPLTSPKLSPSCVRRHQLHNGRQPDRLRGHRRPYPPHAGDGGTRQRA